ncbi:hypothetical protein C7H09_00055 [Marinobacter fuscus]|uniref:Uncharacterized protein n=2 Tax=Marinobacter fuscus TaxID=2109942 RepID=A0A2T1KW35_9GAMM|nr:hypothetical protein C7H09_00055 [Marinobacter fuscus]
MLIMNVLFIGFALVMWWSYQDYSAYLRNIVNLQKPLLVFHKQQSALFFVWVPMMSALITINIEVFYVRLMKKRVPPLMAKLQKVATWVMFLGVALAVFGNQLINPAWSETFKEAGYSRCNTVIVRANKQFFNDAWVLEPADCYDRGLKQILHEDHGKRGFEKGARYLEKKHEFLQSREAVHNPGAGL